MSPQSIIVDAILFDMDGTLLDSTPGVNATWEQYATEYDLDLDKVLKSESPPTADSAVASSLPRQSALILRGARHGGQTMYRRASAG